MQAQSLMADQPPQQLPQRNAKLATDGKRKPDGTNTGLACMRMLPFISSPTHNQHQQTNTTSELDHTSVHERQCSQRPANNHHQQAMTTRSSYLLLLFLVVLALPPAVQVRAAPSAGAPATVDTVADSCDAIRDFVDYAFCAAALRSSGPGAATADRHAHLLVAADLAAARGTSARDDATAMARDERDPAARDGMEACGILYGATSVPALQFMRGYAAARAWDRARSLLSLTGQAGIGCEAALAGAPAAKGRMAAANREFDQLTTMATALLNRVDHLG